MKPFEQIRRYTILNLWHLLPFSYISVRNFDLSELTVAFLPYLVMQCSITSGLLLWGFKTIGQKKARKVWIWMQASVTSIILWMSITELVTLSKWLSITLHFGLLIIWFIALYKMLIVGYEVPSMRNRTLENPLSD